MFRLLAFAPYELVLEKEKQWHKARYLAKVRDKNVLREVRSANKRAVRDADMCVARAQSIVESLQAGYLEKHPEGAVYFLIMKSLSDEMTNRGVTKKG
jgi:ureidoglycolate hydrolase